MIGIGISPTFTRGQLSVGSVGNLIAAYEADYGITLNGSTVSAWAPKYVKTPVGAETESGLRALYTLTQSTAGYQPTYYANRGDGLPEIRFDGTDDYMINDAVAAVFPLDKYGIAAHGELIGEANDDRWLWIGDWTNQNSTSSRVYTGGGLASGMKHYIINTTSSESFITQDTQNKRCPLVFSRNGTELKAQTDSYTASLTSSGSSLSYSANRLALGCRALPTGLFDVFCACKISALYLYSSSIDLAGTVQFIKTRYPDY
jgi:hypothetical protein